MSTKELISVYKSPKKAEMYVYVRRKEGVDGLPDALKQVFGEPVHVMDIVLTDETKLARVDAAKVKTEIEGNGFYLQMPPGKESYMLDLYKAPKDSLHG